jgi:HK97 family phage major capsid protein
MSVKLDSLRQKNAEIAVAMTSIAAKAESEDGRGLKPEEQQKFDEYDAAFKANEEEIARLERLEEIQNKMTALQPRVIQPAPEVTPQPKTGAVTITGGTPAAHNYKNHGFEKGPGEFLFAVYRAGTDGYRDPRLMVNAVTTYGGESGAGADGAYALPPQFLSGIMDAVIPEDSFLRAMNPIQTNSNVLVVPTNEKAPWSTTGIKGTATAEAGSITVSKPALGEVRATLYKAASLVHVSEEALSDIPFLSTWVMNQMGQHLNYILENWVVNGSGEGEPVGVRNAAALISLADVDSDATTIGPGQVLSMESCLLPGSGAFWLASPTVLPAIATMKTGSAGYPLFQPDMTVPTKRALLGRPYYTSEACPALNTAGDLILIQPSGYIFALKAGGVQTATTVGFAFDQDLQSFRSTIRAGGAPLLSAKVTRANGSTYASHFITNVGSKS